MTPGVGGVPGAAISTNVTSTIDIGATTTGALTLTPTNDFNGSINVTTLSLKPAIGGTVHAAIHRHPSIVYADLALLTPQNGDQVYCADCKNVTDDGTGTFDSVAASGGHGTTVLYENGSWRVH